MKAITRIGLNRSPSSVVRASGKQYDAIPRFLKDRWILRGISTNLIFLATLAGLAYLGLKGVPPFQRWSVNSLLMAVAILLYQFFRFERAAAGPRELALLATLAAVAAAGRVFFAAVPGVQPVTFMALLTGYVFGSESGFVVGALAALLSNFFLGHGPWTPWQMLGWGMAGLTGGLLCPISRGDRRRATLWGTRFLVLAGLLWGFLFGWMMDFWYWISFIRPLDWRSLVAAVGSSFWFDLFHSLGNAVFAFLLGPAMFSSLLRFRGRLEVVWEKPSWENNPVDVEGGPSPVEDERPSSTSGRCFVDVAEMEVNEA